MIDLGYEEVFVDRFLNDLIFLSDINNENTSNEIQQWFYLRGGSVNVLDNFCQ